MNRRLVVAVLTLLLSLAVTPTARVAADGDVYRRWVSPKTATCATTMSGVTASINNQNVEFNSLPAGAEFTITYIVNGVVTNDGPHPVEQLTGTKAYGAFTQPVASYPFTFQFRLDTLVGGQVVYRSTLDLSCTADGSRSVAAVNQTVGYGQPYRRWTAPKTFTCATGMGGPNVTLNNQDVEFNNLPVDAQARLTYVRNGVAAVDPPFTVEQTSGTKNYSSLQVGFSSYPFTFSFYTDTLIGGSLVYRSIISTSCAANGSGTATVTSTAPPTIASAPNVSATAPPGASGTAVTYALPAANDDAGTPTVSCLPASGSTFALGTTTVGCTATDSVGLTASTSFTVTVTAGLDYVSLSPARVADTRLGFATVDGIGAGTGLRLGGTTLEVTVAGRGGVAADAVAAALNVTATGVLGDGFATVYPCGETFPTASNLNFTVGSTVPNAVLAKLGTGGKVCVFVSQSTNIVVDVDGYFPAGSSYVSENPVRVLETRPGRITSDGLQQGGGPVGAGVVTELQITGRAGVPTTANAVALNVTVTEPASDGFITVFPCGTTQPTASSLNAAPGQTVANLVVSKLGTGGKVCIYTQQSTHLVADVNGYFPGVTSYASLVPARLLETRAGQTTIDGQYLGAGIRPLGSVTEVAVLGRGGVPAAAATVVLNVTATEAVAAGYVTVYPCGISPPLASNLNIEAGATTPNAVFVKVGAGGKVCLFNSQATHLVVDVVGYFPN